MRGKSLSNHFYQNEINFPSISFFFFFSHGEKKVTSECTFTSPRTKKKKSTIIIPTFTQPSSSSLSLSFLSPNSFCTPPEIWADLCLYFKKAHFSGLETNQKFDTLFDTAFTLLYTPTLLLSLSLLQEPFGSHLLLLRVSFISTSSSSWEWNVALLESWNGNSTFPILFIGDARTHARK